MTFNFLTTECKGEQQKAQALPSIGNLKENAHCSQVEPQRDVHAGRLGHSQFVTTSYPLITQKVQKYLEP